MVQLKVSEDAELKKDTSGETPPRRYSYTELLDLHSRLMLVAGQAEQGKENVDRFTTVSPFFCVVLLYKSCLVHTEEEKACCCTSPVSFTQRKKKSVAVQVLVWKPECEEQKCVV